MNQKHIVRKLLAWFAQNARALPWRRTRDPYAIWVSEVMLQQTQVKTVLRYWERWMRALPDLEALAKAKPQTLHKLWEGLGYYTRVRNLQRAAQIIRERHGGRFPQDFEAVLALPGIGRYTAGAICSIAFDQPKPILDGNVIRVLTRLYGIAGDPRAPRTRARLWQLAAELVQSAAQGAGRHLGRITGVRPSAGAAGPDSPCTHPDKPPMLWQWTSCSPSPQPSPLGRGRTLARRSPNPKRLSLSSAGLRGPLSPGERVGVRGNGSCEHPNTADTEICLRSSEHGRTPARSYGVCSCFNQSLMELGALVCTPRQPRCSACPVVEQCVAFRQGRVDQLPRPRRRTRAVPRRFAAFVAQKGGRFFVRQRPAGVANAHLWEFPNLELAPGDSDLRRAARQVLGVRSVKPEPLATIRHSITRYRITLEAYRATASSHARPGAAKGRWLRRSQLKHLAFTSAHKRILQLLPKEVGPAARRGIWE
jgi:adenine-specific DNA glycosylase